MIDIKEKREEEYKESEKERIIYLVYSIDADGKHYCLPRPSELEAIKEAERLASIRPENWFYVMRSLCLIEAREVLVGCTETCK